jgi:hypothetical protein
MRPLRFRSVGSESEMQASDHTIDNTKSTERTTALPEPLLRASLFTANGSYFVEFLRLYNKTRGGGAIGRGQPHQMTTSIYKTTYLDWQVYS